MKTCFISASPRSGGLQNTSPAGVLLTPFSGSVISCLPPKHHFFGTTLPVTSLTFRAGKFHVWEIGLFEDLLFSNSESGARAAQQLLRAQRGGGRRGRLRSRPDSSSRAAASPALRRTEAGAGSEQQLVRLLVGPQEDEPSQADGCHPRDNTCKQAEGKGKAASE